jgi:hypothetical protein
VTRQVPNVILAALLLLTGSPAAADLSSTIETCVLGMNDEGYQFTAIADACPEAIALVEDYRLAGSLGEDWRQWLTYWQAEQLAYFESYYDQQPAEVRLMNPAALDDIVDRLDNPEVTPERQSLWERFNEWLRETFRDEENEIPAWLGEWLSDFRVPQSILEKLFWAIAVMIVIASLVVIAIEVRAARTGIRPARPRSPAAAQAHAARGYRTLTLKDLERAALQDKPGIMLQLVMQRMENLGLVPRRPACTHRELAIESAGLGEKGRQTVQAISVSAERVRYGGQTPQATEVDELVHSGVSLLKNMESGQDRA